MVKDYIILAAKTDSENDNLWLPLWMHLKDTAGVMKKLVHRWIPMSVVNAAGLSFEEFEAAAIFTAAVHDIGKATSYFQSVLSIKSSRRDQLRDAGYVIRSHYISAGKTPHSYAGQWILQSDTTGIGADSSIASVVGAHHGKPISINRRTGEPDLLKVYKTNFYGDEKEESDKSIWINTWKQIVDEALRLSGISSVGELPKLNTEAQVILSGLLITADWLSSNTGYFPLISLGESGSVDEYPSRIDDGFRRISFPDGWRSELCNMDEDLFEDRFGFSPNDIQREMIRAVEGCSYPGIFILEAQMGVGKTESALAAAELLASACESGGIFFGLPTQATSNGLFGRLYNWADAVSEDTENAIRLAHSAAEFNEEYEYFMEKGRALVNNVEDDEDYDGGLSAHPWFQGNKKALLADFVIGTVDQFLMASLRRKHFMLRHLGLAGKVVIIDECHAYDAYMNQYLDRSLQWMAAYGVPVILLSATLPEKRRNDLVKTYRAAYAKYFLGKGRTEIEKSSRCESNNSYPLLTWTDGETIHQKEIKQSTGEKIVEIKKVADIDAMMHELDMSLKDGGCACIILNTVKKAQEVYEKVKEELDDVKILLYHAQFTMPDRAEKEKKILRHMGKSSNEVDRYRYVLIGTQVLEQSLDYDADIMISQLCPMDLLLQRMGRLHRHVRKRPESLTTPNFIILGNDDGLYDKGTESVYGSYLLMRTEQCLKSRFLLPQDIPVLVQKVYGEVGDDGLEKNEDIVKAKEKFDTEQAGKIQRANGFLLKKPPGKRGGIEGMLDNADQTIESAAESKVRDGISSIEVLLMRKVGERYAVCTDKYEVSLTQGIPHGNEVSYEEYGENISENLVNLFETPDNGVGKIIARQRIRLSHIFSQTWNIDQTIRELEEMNRRELPAWQRSPWLKGELILLLDEDGTVDLNGFCLSYDHERGLQYAKKKEVTDAGEGI